MNILITGGAGFIGSCLANKYIKAGHEVYVLDDLSTGTPRNIEECGVKEDNFIIGKVENEYVVRFFRSVDLDMIMHFASPASPIEFKKSPINILESNLTGTRNMLNLALSNEAKFIFASTSEVYGNPPRSELPLKESYNGNVNPLGIRGCYDEGKRGGEAYCKAYERKYNMNIGIVRIFNTYGPRMPDDGRAIPTFIRQALEDKPLTVHGNGQQTRAFLYIQDLVEGIMKFATLPHYVECSPMNIGAIKETTVLGIATGIQTILGKNPKFEYVERGEDDPEYRLPDISLAKRMLGWEPKIPLVLGLEATINYFKRIYK